MGVKAALAGLLFATASLQPQGGATGVGQARGLGVIVDYFAGGGGASTGVERAYGRKVDLAVNHNPKALAMHEANHDGTLHACCDVFEFDLVAWLGARLWDVWWLSPDCTHHSRAKGGKPVENKRRALADIALQVLAKLPPWQRPRVIHLENVPEFREWGPLHEEGPLKGRPDKSRKGEYFDAWVNGLRAFGYDVGWADDIAADHGDPTTRKRFCLVARCDGLPIVRPQATHYNPKAKRKEPARGRLPWRTAAECIDFSKPGRSIFGRKKPLADATLSRVARGTFKFVINNPKPFIVPMTHHGQRREHPLDEPFPTVTCAHRGELAIVEPFLAGCGGRAGQSPEKSAGEPFNTLTTKADGIVVTPHIVSVAHGDSGGRREYGVDEALGTVHASGQSRAMVEAAMTPFVAGITQKSTPRIFDAEAPAPTITTAKGGELLAVTPFIQRVDMASAAARNGVRPTDEPTAAITTSGPFAVTTAHMLRLQGSDRRDREMDAPLGAVCAGGEHHAKVAAFLAQYNNDASGPHAGRAADAPVSTIATTGSHQALVEVGLTADEIEAGCERVLAFMMKYYGTAVGHALDEPCDTVTTKDRFALITVHIAGVPYRIYDIRIRMLTPRELFNAQGFPAAYEIRPWITAPKKLTKAMRKSGRVATVSKRMSNSDSIACCGNSVPPGLAYAWAKANAPPMSRLEGRDRWAEKRAA